MCAHEIRRAEQLRSIAITYLQFCDQVMMFNCLIVAKGQYWGC